MSDNDYAKGFDAGYHRGLSIGKAMAQSGKDYAQYIDDVDIRVLRDTKARRKKPKRKQSGKAKILTAMTAPVWKKYKKGSGKKTYVQIRAQVSRSQAYKRKVKKL
jgi:hypothetical protein